METKRQIEVFSAGCPACDETQASGPDEASLRAAGIGVPLP